MISVGAYGGLSAADLMKLFSSNSASSTTSSSSTTATATASSASPESTNDPAATIKAILAKSEVEPSVGGWGSITSVNAAYAAQLNGTTTTVSANLTIATPDAAKQIEDAVSTMNQSGIGLFNGDVGQTFTVTANDAIAVIVGSGSISMTAVQGSNVAGQLPSLGDIQSAYSSLLQNDQGIGVAGSEDFGGSFTLVKLPPGNGGGESWNYITFDVGNQGLNNWALVLPNVSISASVAETTTKA